jgi:hypothetical protein
LTNEQLMISGTGSRGIGVSTTTSGDPYFRLYNNTTIVGDMWWGRSGNFQGINSLGAGSITAINPFGGNVLIGTTTDSGARLHISGRTQISGGSLDSSTLTDLGIVSALTTGRSGTFQSDSLASISTRGDASSIELIAGVSSGFYTGISATANNASTFAGVLRLLTAGNERMRITSAGEVQLKQSSNSAQNSVIFNTTIQNAMTLNSSGFLILNGTTGSSRITCYGDGYFSGGIQTGNPYGSTSANWLLGRFLTETTSANGSIRVQIGSKYYNIAAEDLGTVPT